MSTYRTELRRFADLVLPEHPELLHRWGEDGALLFPAMSTCGFDVSIHPSDVAVIVYAGCGAHVHFESEPEEAVRDALGFVRDLLSPDMRVREFLSNGHPYRWTIEVNTDSGWQQEKTTGLLLWNYFGKRTERLYCNEQLPGRLRI